MWDDIAELVLEFLVEVFGTVFDRKLAAIQARKKRKEETAGKKELVCQEESAGIKEPASQEKNETGALKRNSR